MKIKSAMGKINGVPEKEEKTTSWVFPNGEQRILKVTLAGVLEMLEEVANLMKTEAFTTKEYAEIIVYMSDVISAIIRDVIKYWG